MSKKIEIEIPSIEMQRMAVFENGIKESIDALRKNLEAAPYPKAASVDYSALDARYFMTIEQGWIAPPCELVNAWFEQFKATFPQYGVDKTLAALLGIHSNGASRRIREYRNGEKPIPYGVWRKFLVITGRVKQEIYPVMGVFDILKAENNE
ncbi:hypothetical protein D6K16_22925 [Salmonella enterica subsp. enterica serovar Enteritidis]|nr:hypothetical protein [Salmonella enterica subsp. enterica serovar Enteritidis]MMA06876.1 hypothetical protein [Salmonella enterica subsp. enterica serovar Enteritidis]